MSYDIYLTDPETKETFLFDKPHRLKGGTYIGGTREAWLNITYNYSEHFVKVLGDKGIRAIYGMTGAQSIPILEIAISNLKSAAWRDDIHPDYWHPTEGNARNALKGLLALANAAPHGIWQGD